MTAIIMKMLRSEKHQYAILRHAIIGAVHNPSETRVLMQIGRRATTALFTAGAQRISLGACPMLAAMGTIRDIALEVRASGSREAMQRSFYGFHQAEALFAVEGRP
ncbi:hypothetical protein [Collimonas humicola]|uniref:hypothetical protein n=1 Tax=Collimonas humicola TaxID=2825886 RepID=UPI001B8AE63D|nr:hypothetical protein [Collimonas humicola]